jgi:hypothetical protein
MERLSQVFNAMRIKCLLTTSFIHSSHCVDRTGGAILLLRQQCRLCKSLEDEAHISSQFLAQTNFIQQPLPPGSHTGAGGPHGQSGALGLGQRASTGLGTFYQFWCYVVPLFGAYVADTHWGRYKTISWSLLIAMLGHLLMIVSALPGVIEKSKSAAGVFSVSLVIMGIGTGGFKANISPLVAEQYKRTKLFVSTTKSGERVIVDPLLTTSRIYMVNTSLHML